MFNTGNEYMDGQLAAKHGQPLHPNASPAFRLAHNAVTDAQRAPSAPHIPNTASDWGLDDWLDDRWDETPKWMRRTLGIAPLLGAVSGFVGSLAGLFPLGWFFATVGGAIGGAGIWIAARVGIGMARVTLAAARFTGIHWRKMLLIGVGGFVLFVAYINFGPFLNWIENMQWRAEMANQP